MSNNKNGKIFFNSGLKTITNLAWQPWIGENYGINDNNILVVGETHYTDAKTEEAAELDSKRILEDRNFTCDIIKESPLQRKWRNNTFDNIYRVLSNENLNTTHDLWHSIAFYNFIQRPMKYHRKERPTYIDFFEGWKTFSELLTILKPKKCLFIGVEAANTFEAAMKHLGIEYSKIFWDKKIGRVYPRKAKVTISPSLARSLCC